MRLPIVFLALIVGSSAAMASGGLDCEGTGSKAGFTVHGGVTRGMGGPLFDFSGELKITDKAVAEDLRKTSFDKSHVAQYWFDGDELRLDLYRERAADKEHGYVELVVKTKSKGDEGDFVGTFEATVFDTTGSSEGKETTYKGKVSCFTE